MSYTKCFACGKGNSVGLKMDFFVDDIGRYCSRFIGRPEHVGYSDMMHGGIVATLLDEVMARVVFEEGLFAVTAELNVRYLKPTPVGEELLVRAVVDRRRGKLFRVSGEILLVGGAVSAVATAKIMALDCLEIEDGSILAKR